MSLLAVLTASKQGLNIAIIVEIGNLDKMGSKKDIIFYIVAANVIALIAGVAGASLPVILFSALLAPPLLLLIIRIIR